MAHSNSQFPADATVQEYGDDTCAMGFCCTDRCWNTPHAWQMGWLSIRNLGAANLVVNRTYQYYIYTQSSYSSNSAIRVDVPAWMPAEEPIFLGYRQARTADANVSRALMDGSLRVPARSVPAPAAVACSAAAAAAARVLPLTACSSSLLAPQLQYPVLGVTLDDRVHLYSSGILNTYTAAATTWRAALAGEHARLPSSAPARRGAQPSPLPRLLADWHAGRWLTLPPAPRPAPPPRPAVNETATYGGVRVQRRPSAVTAAALVWITRLV